MVDPRSFPPGPGIWPDPDGFKTFAEWLRALTAKDGRYRVKQTTIAEVAGKSPQAVTKWLNGGSIDIENLVRIAEWSGFSYPKLRRLLEEPKIGVISDIPSVLSVQDARANYLGATAKSERDDLHTLFRRLTPANRQQLLGMAKLLLAKQVRRK